MDAEFGELLRVMRASGIAIASVLIEVAEAPVRPAKPIVVRTPHGSTFEIEEPCGQEAGLEGVQELLAPDWRKQYGRGGFPSETDGPPGELRPGFTAELYWREYTPHLIGRSALEFLDYNSFQRNLSLLEANADRILRQWGVVDEERLGLFELSYHLHINSPTLKKRRSWWSASMVPDLVGAIAERMKRPKGPPEGGLGTGGTGKRGRPTRKKEYEAACDDFQMKRDALNGMSRVEFVAEQLGVQTETAERRLKDYGLW